MKPTSVFRSLCSALVFISSGSGAALHDRGNGLIYDDVLNVTWLQDLNLAASQSFGVSGIENNGSMNWEIAQAWVSAMNAFGETGYLGFNDWRLPMVRPLNGISFVFFQGGVNQDTIGATDVGYNIAAPDTPYAGSTASELAHLHYVSLGNKAGFALPYPPVTSRPFVNLQTFEGYWTGTEVETDRAFFFSFRFGFQGRDGKGLSLFALPVRDGDVSPIPESSRTTLLVAGVACLLARRNGLRALRSRRAL